MNNTQYTKYLFDKVRDISNANPGVIRDTYGNGENLTHKFLIKELKKFKTNITIDYGGNFLASYEGKNRKTIVIGSHLDSQKHGGNYDGLAGVVMGIVVIKNLFEKKITPKYSIAVMGIRGEESCWFPYSYIGSKIALGKFDKKLLHSLKRTDTQKSLYDHINLAGFDSKKVSRNKINFDISNIKYFIEPHIEQGPVLEKKRIPLGIVTGIRGSFRYRDAYCVGEYLHSGATPFEYRKDTVVAVSMLVNEMNILWQKELKKNKDLVITFGQFSTDHEQHSFAKSSGLVQFCIDVRSNSNKTLQLINKRFFEKIKFIEKKTKTKFFLGNQTNSEPALMDKKLIKIFQKFSNENSIKSETMASGAGHDASVFANNGIPSIMLFIRNKNGSHNPKEYMSIEQFMRVFKVLSGTIEKDRL